MSPTKPGGQLGSLLNVLICCNLIMLGIWIGRLRILVADLDSAHKHFLKAWLGKVSCGQALVLCLWDFRWGLWGLQNSVELWLRAQSLCGDVAALCSLINNALAANEIEHTELPLWLCERCRAEPALPRHSEHSRAWEGGMEPLSQARCGLSLWVGCGKSGTLFCKSQALQYRPAHNDLPKYLPDSTSQMQSIKSVKLRIQPLNKFSRVAFFVPF